MTTEVDDDSEPARRFTIMQMVTVVAVTALLTSLISWQVAQDESHFSDTDIGFLADMTTHHEGAISLSFAYLPNENDPVVTDTAHVIIRTQSVEIATMNRFLDQAGGDVDAIVNDDVAMEWMGTPVVAPELMPGLATQADYDELQASTGVAADDVFTRLMIDHHAAGVVMAEYEARHGENDDVRRFAKKIAGIQRVEITEMNQRRELLGLAVHEPEDVHAHHRRHARG